MTRPPIDPERVADDTARRLLERAAAIDDSSVALEHLRESALEAGISTTAFDSAVAKWRLSSHRDAPMDLSAHCPAVHGMGTHVMLMGAGLASILFVLWIGPRRHAS